MDSCVMLVMEKIICAEILFWKFFIEVYWLYGTFIWNLLYEPLALLRLIFINININKFLWLSTSWTFIYLPSMKTPPSLFPLLYVKWSLNTCFIYNLWIPIKFWLFFHHKILFFCLWGPPGTPTTSISKFKDSMLCNNNL